MPIDLRRRTSARFNDQNGSVTTRSGILPIHAQTAPDSDIWTQPIDMRPNRITTGGNDLWVVRDNEYGFGMGQPAGRGDGWILWEPRQRELVVASRLQRLGYLRPSTNTFTDISSAPTYSRANLEASLTSSQQFGGETFYKRADVWWRDLWPDLPTGQVDLHLAVMSDWLKEEIVLDQAAREWIAANRPPPSPANQHAFGALFELDWGQVQDFVRDGDDQIFDPTSSFDDELFSGDFLIRGPSGVPCGRMMRGDAYVRLETPDTTRPGGGVQGVPAYRRFWIEAGTPVMFVGIRVSELAGLPPGELIIDPPQTTTVDALDAAQDGYDANATTWRENGTIGSQINYLWWNGTVRTSNYNAPCARFDTSAMNDDPVTDAYWSMYGENDTSGSGDGNCDYIIVAEDTANAATISSTNMAVDAFDGTLTVTTAQPTGTIVVASHSDGVYIDYDITSIMAELEVSYGNTIVDTALFMEITDNNENDWVSWEDSALAANDNQITVTQTAAGVGIPLVYHHRKLLGG